MVKTLLGTYDILEERAKDDVLSVAGYGAFVLTPKERPVVVVLEVIGTAEEETGRHVSWDE